MSTTWTDDELRSAIAGSRSWRETARALALRGISGGALRTVKKRAALLGLDTSHFTGQRRWTDRALRTAIEDSDTWGGVLRTLGLTDDAETRLRVRGHGVRLGVDVSHLNREAAPPRQSIFGPATMLRFAAEPIAIAWYSMRGIPVAVPTRPTAYDLLVTLPEGVQRVQVKSTTWRGSHGSWRANIGQRPYVLDKTASRMPYDPEALDYFFVIDGEGVLYWIPISVVAGLKTINVGAYSAFMIGNCSSLMESATVPAASSLIAP